MQLAEKNHSAPSKEFVPPLSRGLIDNYGRSITYLRLAITDRCNLRCRYCMPAHGVDFVPHHEILSFEELERLVLIFTSMGITKVRITGGEPFARKGCVSFLRRLKKNSGIDSLHVTTNGVETFRYLDDLSELGISGINLSLDTLNPKRFWQITRRNSFEQVNKSFQGLLERNIPLKLNSVVLDDTTDEEIIALASLPRAYPVSLRFIEKMPFSGEKVHALSSSGQLGERLQTLFPGLVEKIGNSPCTARNYSPPGFCGTIGLIEGNSRRFCGTCNKVRITPQGMLKTCLYDNGVLDLKYLMRNGRTDGEIQSEIKACIQKRFADGHETDAYVNYMAKPSMASIGG